MKKRKIQHNYADECKKYKKNIINFKRKLHSNSILPMPTAQSIPTFLLTY